MFDVSSLLADLKAVSARYHQLFDGRLPDPGRAVQFDAFMSTVQMAVTHSAAEAAKGA